MGKRKKRERIVMPGRELAFRGGGENRAPVREGEEKKGERLSSKKRKKKKRGEQHYEYHQQKKKCKTYP